MFLKNILFLNNFVKISAKKFFLFKVRGAGAEIYCWSRSHIISGRLWFPDYNVSIFQGSRKCPALLPHKTIGLNLTVKEAVFLTSETSALLKPWQPYAHMWTDFWSPVIFNWLKNAVPTKYVILTILHTFWLPDYFQFIARFVYPFMFFLKSLWLSTIYIRAKLQQVSYYLELIHMNA